MRVHSFPIIGKPSYRNKLSSPSNDRIIVPAGAADDLDIAALIPAAHNPYMAILGVEHQISWLALVPRNQRAVPMFCFWCLTSFRYADDSFC